jgi:HSP20 family protein
LIANSTSLPPDDLAIKAANLKEDTMATGYLSPYRRRSIARGPQLPGLFDLHRKMNRLFDDLFDQEGDSGFYARSGMSAPAMDINNAEDKIEICAELPGVKEDDVDISIDDGILTLRGEKKSTRKDEETGYSERSYGTFERRITLPSNIDVDACSAEFKDGVLTITVPKTEEKSRGRRIPLRTQQVGSGDAEDMLIERKDLQQQGSWQPEQEYAQSGRQSQPGSKQPGEAGQKQPGQHSRQTGQQQQQAGQHKAGQRSQQQAQQAGKPSRQTSGGGTGSRPEPPEGK